MRRVVISFLFIIAALAIQAQNISEIAKSDPLIITGAIATQNTYYHSSSGGGGRNPWNNSVYLNLNISTYSINMPFTFTLVNNNSSWSYPYVSFDVSPTYKDWTLHLGTRSMAFSSYVYNIPFTGAGVEYHHKKFRFGAFYGRLQKAINDDPTDPTARRPQYYRMGWGLKVGYGSGNNYLDLYMFRAKDRVSSVDDGWRDIVSPQENLVVGFKGRVQPLKFFSLSANFATSVFTTDTRAQKLNKDVYSDFWSKIYDARYTSLYRFAGDVTANLRIKRFNISANYKLVQPDYKTLGISYITNNIESYGLGLSGSLLKGIVSFNGRFSGQQDNITKRQLYTTKGYVYSANTNINLSRSLSLNASYNGYRQLQTDGTVAVNDTTQVNRIMHSATGTVNYDFNAFDLLHTASFSYNFSKNKDLNRFNEGASDIETHAFGIDYSVSESRTSLTVMTSFNHQTSKSTDTKFTTDMVSLGASMPMLAEKNLTFSLDLSLSRNATDDQRTTSLGGSVRASYLLLKEHQFSLMASYNRFSDLTYSRGISYTGSDLTLCLNYSYSFTLLQIKRKASKEDNL